MTHSQEWKRAPRNFAFPKKESAKSDFHYKGWWAGFRFPPLSMKKSPPLKLEYLSLEMSTDPKKRLLDWAEPQGGFDWNRFDLNDAMAIAKDDAGFALRINYIPWDAPITARSKFNMSCEDYVKRTILEEFHVLCQVHSVGHDKKGCIQWIMQGVCPFHRRIHRQQRWIINEGTANQDSFIMCFHPSKRYTSNLKYQRYPLPGLPLVSHGDNPLHYPLDISKHQAIAHQERKPAAKRRWSEDPDGPVPDN